MAKYLDSDGVAYLWSKIKNKFAPLASPGLTGTPTAPTPSTGDDSTKIATTAFVQNTVSSMTSGVSGVKGDAESTYRTGNVNLTPANIGAATSSHTHGNITNGGDITASAPTIASGDKIIINDESASKITNGPSFGTSTTTYLRNDGTWATPTDTDTKVIQSVVGTNDNHPLIFTTAANLQSQTTSGVSFNAQWKLNPNTGDLTIGYINGISIDASGGNSLIITDESSFGIEADDYYVLGDACTRDVATSVSSGSNDLVTSSAVYSAINNAVVGSLNYQGVVTAQSGLGTTYKKGYYWIVGSVTAGTQIAGQVVETGDMILAHADYSGTIANDVDVVQSNVDRMTNTDIDNAVVAGEAL